MNVYGLVVPINQLKPSDEPPFELEHPDLHVFRFTGAAGGPPGWAVVWVLTQGAMEFGMSLVWAQGVCSSITQKYILPNGYQGGEHLVVMFDLEEGDDLDLDMLIVRYDWSNKQETP
jgi:hypothetical protein